jgi:hypothetical protein
MRQFYPLQAKLSKFGNSIQMGPQLIKKIIPWLTNGDERGLSSEYDTEILGGAVWYMLLQLVNLIIMEGEWGRLSWERKRHYVILLYIIIPLSSEINENYILQAYRASFYFPSTLSHSAHNRRESFFEEPRKTGYWSSFSDGIWFSGPTSLSFITSFRLYSS